MEEQKPSRRPGSILPSHPEVGEPFVIKSISLEGGVMRVYAQSEEEIFTVTLSVSPDPSSIMRKSQMIKRDRAFQLPYRSTPVSSSLICRSLARLIGVDSKTVTTVSKGPSLSPFLPVLPEPASTPPVAIPEAISTSPKPPEPAFAPADPSAFDPASAASYELPSSLPELSVLVELADPSPLTSAQQEALKHGVQDTQMDEVTVPSNPQDSLPSDFLQPSSSS